MRIRMHAKEDLEIDEFLAPEMVVNVADPDLAFSALQMFSTSLALCSFSVLFSYGETHGIDPSPIAIRVRWSYASDENRIDAMTMDVRWPGLPASRHAAAQRAAAQCTVHRTLEHPPALKTRLVQAPENP